MASILPPGGVERRGKGGWDEVLATERHLVSPGAEWRSELYRIATDQFRRAADLIGLDHELRQRLIEPRRALVVDFPVRRDLESEHQGSSWRVTAQAAALERVAEASRLRAIYP